MNDATAPICSTLDITACIARAIRNGINDTIRPNTDK